MDSRRFKYFILWMGLTLSLSLQLNAQSKEIIAINKAIENNDHIGLSNYFEPTISLAVPNLRGNNSKVQARYILADFFKEFPANKVEEESKNELAKGSIFCILKYKSTKKSFNFYYKLRIEENSYLISEIQIKERSK